MYLNAVRLLIFLPFLIIMLQDSIQRMHSPARYGYIGLMTSSPAYASTAKSTKARKRGGT